MTTHHRRTHEHRLLVATAALGRRLAAAERRLLEQADELGLLRRLVAELEGRPAAVAEARHVPAADAAARLGVDVRSVRRMIEGGQLLGRALRLPGSSRKHWVVNALALARLVGSSVGTPAAPAARVAELPGAPRPRTRG